MLCRFEHVALQENLQADLQAEKHYTGQFGQDLQKPSKEKIS